MIPPSFFRRGLVLLALMLVLPWHDGRTALAQEAGTDMGDSINFQRSPVNSILDLYEQLSGKRLIRDSALDTAPPMSLSASGLDKADRLKFIEASLLLNGISIVPLDDKTAKAILMQAQSKNPRSEGIKIYANAADLPNDEEVVSYYMPLNYISPTEAQGIFNAHAPAHAYGSYVQAPSAQAIVLTENVSVIRQLIALKELVDVPPAAVTSEFVQLKRADAEKVADLLNKLLQPPPGTPGAAAPANGGVFVPAGLGNGEPMSNEHNLISGTAQIVPDPRSNRLLVVTRPVNMPFLNSLITQLDEADNSAPPQRWPLKYVLAQDILPALEAAVAQGKDEEDQVKKDATTATTATGAQNQPVNSGGGPNNGSSSGSASGSGITSVTSPLQTPKENNVPTVVIIGKTRIMADNRTNSIMAFGSSDAVARISAMIDQLDRRPLQVRLATVIGELTVSEGQEFGIDILQKFQKVGQGGLASSLVTPGSATANAANTTSTGTTTTTGSAVPEPGSLISSLGFPLPSGLTLYGAIGSTLDAYVRALGTTNRFKIISRPSVYTTNNKLAVISSGSQIPVPGTTVSGLNNNNALTSSSTTTYVSVQLDLEIIPLINANHEVTLQIRQTNNSEGSSQIISGNSVPTILTQEINTNVTVPDKSTIVIGGLISDNNTRKTSGVPWLSDIPLLGYLFKDTSKSKERDELIIMIQPTVVETDADQVASNETEKQRTILGREALEAATGSSATVPAAAQGRADAKPPGPPLTPGMVPAASTVAPDVGNGQVPKDTGLPGPTTTP
jgi:type II secretion system protein D